MTNTLVIQIVDSPSEAPHYSRDHCDIRTATIDRAVIVCKGTVNGNPTVDIVFKDADGAEYVAMLTGSLIQNLAAAVTGAAQR